MDVDDPYDTPAFRVIKFAEELIKPVAGDSRPTDHKQRDAIIYLLKGIILELEKIGDQLKSDRGTNET